ncbi:hypothetical protein GOB93_09405 [Acetobacter musti]|uniref:Secreted protein n=1 Tax=Acetobacter musti TaxID=864732 RepID=A0ABX0JPE6_9PROT|nr:hypothetical protein [Acetobacter musti]NHN84855.1 hypothetical protein [Acetobacter musti]
MNVTIPVCILVVTMNSGGRPVAVQGGVNATSDDGATLVAHRHRCQRCAIQRWCCIFRSLRKNGSAV